MSCIDLMLPAPSSLPPAGSSRSLSPLRFPSAKVLGGEAVDDMQPRLGSLSCYPLLSSCLLLVLCPPQFVHRLFHLVSGVLYLVPAEALSAGEPSGRGTRTYRLHSIVHRRTGEALVLEVYRNPHLFKSQPDILSTFEFFVPSKLIYLHTTCIFHM